MALGVAGDSYDTRDNCAEPHGIAVHDSPHGRQATEPEQASNGVEVDALAAKIHGKGSSRCAGRAILDARMLMKPSPTTCHGFVIDRNARKSTAKYDFPVNHKVAVSTVKYGYPEFLMARSSYPRLSRVQAGTTIDAPRTHLPQIR
jgi:hypothetical protein